MMRLALLALGRPRLQLIAIAAPGQHSCTLFKVRKEGKNGWQWS